MTSAILSLKVPLEFLAGLAKVEVEVVKKIDTVGVMSLFSSGYVYPRFPLESRGFKLSYTVVSAYFVIFPFVC